MEKLLVFVFTIVFAVAFGALFAFPVMWLLNGCIAPAFLQTVLGVSQVTWLHAWGLLTLCNLLIKSGGYSTSKT